MRTRPLARIFTALAAWLMLSGATGSSYQLAVAANRPPCEAERDPSVRCRGTRGTRAIYSVSADTMLWFEQNDPAPVTFLFVGPLVVEPFAYPSPALGIGLREGAGRLILEVVYGLQRFEQTIEPERWVQVHVPPHSSFWVQVKPTR